MMLSYFISCMQLLLESTILSEFFSVASVGVVVLICQHLFSSKVVFDS